MMPSLPEALAAVQDSTTPMAPLAEQLAAQAGTDVSGRSDTAQQEPLQRDDTAPDPQFVNSGEELEPDTVRVSPDAVFLARAMVSAPVGGSELPMGELETMQIGDDAVQDARDILRALNGDADAALPYRDDSQPDDNATVAMEALPASMLQPATPGAEVAAPPQPGPAKVATEPAAGGAETGGEGGAATMHLAALDPEVMQLQARYALKQAAAQQERETAHHKAALAARKRRRAQVALLVVALAIGSVAGGVGLWLLRGAGKDDNQAVQLDEQLEAFLAGLEQGSEEIPVAQDPAALRALTRKRVLNLVDATWAAVQESDKQIEQVRPLLDVGVARRESDAVAAELAGLAREVRTIRREAIELKLALPEAGDEALPGVAANEGRLRANLLEVRANARAAVDDLLERFGQQLETARARKALSARRPPAPARVGGPRPPPRPAPRPRPPTVPYTPPRA